MSFNFIKILNLSIRTPYVLSLTNKLHRCQHKNVYYELYYFIHEISYQKAYYYYIHSPIKIIPSVLKNLF